MYRPVILAGATEPRAQPPARREPAQAVEEDVKNEQGHPERGHRDAEEAEHPQAAVHRAAPAHGGEHAEADTDQDRDDDGEHGQLDGGRDVLAEVGGHGPMALLGHPEVAVKQLPQVDDVLLGHRLVEAVLVVESLDYGRVAQGALAQVGGSRVGRDQVGEDEGYERDPDHQDGTDPQPPGQEPSEPGGGHPPDSNAGSHLGLRTTSAGTKDNYPRLRRSTSQSPLACRFFSPLVPTTTSAGWMRGMNGPFWLRASWYFSNMA